MEISKMTKVMLRTQCKSVTNLLSGHGELTNALLHSLYKNQL